MSYAVGHRIRIEILAALHEGPASAKELSRIVHQPMSNVTHHIEELFKDGSIDVAYTEERGNISQNFYCAVKMPEYTSEQFAALSAEERQATLALIIQASMAESLASLWAGKLHEDPRVMLAWDWLTLDEQGRAELGDEQDRSWRRIREIAAESKSRLSLSGEKGTTYVVSSFGFERSRVGPPKPIDG